MGIKIKHIVVSIGKGYGTYPIDEFDCGLKEDLTFDANLNTAKQFDTKLEALTALVDLREERKENGFGGNFYIKDIYHF